MEAGLNTPALALDRIEKDRFGAVAFPDDFTFEDACDTMVQTSDKEDESKWTQADTFWHVYETVSPEHAYQLPIPPKLTEQGWDNRLSIAKKFPATRRRAYGVSYVSFYEVVRTLPDALIDKLLTLARTNEWTRAELVDAKKAVSRPCPKCGKVMVKATDTEWVCLSCEHRMEITADAPKPVKTRGVLHQRGNSCVIEIADYLPEGYDDGIEVQITYKRIDKEKAA